VSSNSQAIAPSSSISSRHNRRWSLWMGQVASILRLEIRKNFIGRRALLIYLLAAAPVILMSGLSVEMGSHQNSPNAVEDIKIVFANLYEGLILRTIVFFGCAWIFMNLFRGEIVDKSLHYYFLCPVRREVLVVGKYLSGLVTSVVLFVFSTAGSVFFLFVGLDSASRESYVFQGPGMRHAMAYVGVTVLGCVGYGAVFLVVGLFFRNPMIPALIAYGWEFINFLLPPVLKKISIVHYLHSLVPVPVSEGPFAMVADPTPSYISIPGLLVLTAAVLILASFRIRRMEIMYGSE
jgi:ABC-type transport system involved in multi-copper enzyme maturation permease subunit